MGVPLNRGTLPLDSHLLEADNETIKKVSCSGRDHIMKLREERDRLAYEWSEEYAKRASSAKQSGAGAHLGRVCS